MNYLSLCGTAAATLLLISPLAAQGQNDVDINGGTTVTPPFGNRAFGDVFGDMDVETQTGDIRCLGVEQVVIGGNIQFVVSGADTATVGSGKLYMFDAAGLLLSTTPQTTNSTVWQGRDMEAISDGAGGYTLYVGSDNAELSEYAIDSLGAITHTVIHTVNGLVGTTRALCTSGTDPISGNQVFYTKSFTSDFYAFEDQSGTFNTVNQVANGFVSAYGFGYDAGCNTIWSTDTGMNLTEMDLNGATTGAAQAFYVPGPSGFAGAAQGGLDLYTGDPNNTGSSLSAAHLIQGTPDHIAFVEMAPCGPPPPALVASATCVSGAVTFDVSNMTNSGLFALVGGVAGSSTVGAGPCGATTFPIDVLALPGSPHFVTGNANASGSQQVNVPVPAGACGVVSVVGLDLATCVFTNVVTI